MRKLIDYDTIPRIQSYRDQVTFLGQEVDIPFGYVVHLHEQGEILDQNIELAIGAQVLLLLPLSLKLVEHLLLGIDSKIFWTEG